MKMLTKIMGPLTALSLLSGCYPGYYPYELPPSKTSMLTPGELDARIAAALSMQPELPAPPILMAVANQDPTGDRLLPAEEESYPDGYWTEILLDSGMAAISREIVPGYRDTIERVFADATNGPAETLLMVNEQIESRDENTPLALLYPTLVGIFVVPGSYYTRTVIIDATLWNPRTGEAYFSVTVSASEWYVRPLVWMNEYELAEAARRKARRKLAERLVERLGEG